MNSGGSNDKDRESGLGKYAEGYQRAQPYLDAVWQLIGGVGVGVALGYWLDGRLHTRPWLLLAGTVLGFTAGFIGFFRSLARLSAGKNGGRKS